MAFEINIVVREYQDCLLFGLYQSWVSLEDIGVVSFKLASFDKVLKFDNMAAGMVFYILG